MEGISRASSQQTASIASCAAVAENPAVVTEDVKKESPTEVKSHTEAQKQNALARQGENNLTAMLQRERIAEAPRTNIAKEDVDALAKALNSKEGAEGVKEEFAKAFIKNGAGQHAKIAEGLRQFAAPGTCSNGKAYQALKQEVRDLTKFDPSGVTQPAQRNFFKEVANLRGPGSERVKADVAVMIQHNIDAAEKPSVNGVRAYAGIYTNELRKMLQSDAPGIFRTLVNERGKEKEVSGMIDNLMNHKEGRKAIGEAVVEMTASTTKQMLQSTQENRLAGKDLSLFMKEVKDGIDRNTKTREEMIEKGADLVGAGLQAVEILSPPGTELMFQLADQGIDSLKDAELMNLEETKRKFCSNLDNLVDTTFKSIAVPYGKSATENGDQRKIENYLNAVEVYEKEYRQNR